MRNMLSSQAVSATLYRLADWLRPVNATQTTGSVGSQKSAHLSIFPIDREHGSVLGHLRSPRKAFAHRPLRVVRVLDAEAPRNNAGRIVISGCIADVCAELDRLAKAEGALV